MLPEASTRKITRPASGRCVVPPTGVFSPSLVPWPAFAPGAGTGDAAGGAFPGAAFGGELAAGAGGAGVGAAGAGGAGAGKGSNEIELTSSRAIEVRPVRDPRAISIRTSC